MYDRNRNRKKDPKSTIISLLVIVLFLLPSQIAAILVLMTVLIAPFGYLIWTSLKKKNQSGRASQPRRQTQTSDDCPQPLFCFHRDKGEHHVKRGREIDPWDRPDIDISKYQRK
jgi:hypothetical protein